MKASGMLVLNLRRLSSAGTATRAYPPYCFRLPVSSAGVFFGAEGVLSIAPPFRLERGMLVEADALRLEIAVFHVPEPGPGRDDHHKDEEYEDDDA